jgi:hypothetical protein
MTSCRSGRSGRVGAWSLLGLGVLGALAGAVVGCAHQPQTRLQAEDEKGRDKAPEVKTVGDVTEVSNAMPTQVSGVGLVVGLQGTGGGTPPGLYHTMLAKELRKKGVDHVQERLASDNCAMVLVTAFIPAGAHRFDPLDIEVTLPPYSKARSLRGGYLLSCDLYNYDSTKRLSPDSGGSNRVLQGHRLGIAKGPLLVGFGDGEETAKLKRGMIWGGGVSLIERPFFLTLKNDNQFAAIANAVAERINQTFREDGRHRLEMDENTKRLVVLGRVTGGIEDRFNGANVPGGATAKAAGRDVVYVRVPWEYRLNAPRYLRVARLVPLQDTIAVHTGYRRRLQENLLDPGQTISAALRLEALGNDSVSLLKAGLTSDNLLVRFCAAEALAYLGSPSGAEELARLAVRQPRLRAYCLVALASLNESVCHLKLEEMLAAPSAETRYGAFRALLTMDERDPDIRGELLNEAFWVHRLAPQSPPLVHLALSRRAEVTLFGEEPALVPPFTLVAGEFTVTAAADDDKCTIGRFALQSDTVQRRQCPLQLTEVLRAMADLGANYADAAAFLAQADRDQCLSCRVKVDALPQAPPVEQLAEHAKDPAYWAGADDEGTKAKGDLAGTPSLFRKDAGQPSLAAEDQGDKEKQTAPVDQTASKPSRWTTWCWWRK